MSDVTDRTFPAKVIKVLDEYKIVINRGSRDGIKIGQRFLIYADTDELLQDPDTLEGLGNLEIFKGTGKAIYVKEKWATIESDQRRAPERKTVTKTRNNPVGVASITAALGYSPQIEVEETIEMPAKRIPFEDPSDGDKVKPI